MTPPPFVKLHPPFNNLTLLDEKNGKYRRFVDNVENSEILTTFFVVSAT